MKTKNQIRLTKRQRDIIDSMKTGTCIYMFSKPLKYRLGRLGATLNWDWVNKMIDLGYFETTDKVSLTWNEFKLTKKGKLL